MSVITRSSVHGAMLTATFALVAACSKPTPQIESTPATPVTIVKATQDSVVQPITATGTFGPRDEVPLSFKIGGVVAQVLVDEGETVRRGQTLATLDLREIDAMVAKARVAVDKTSRDQARLERLYKDSVATLSQLQDATSGADAARADLNAAMVNREYATIVAPASGTVLRRQVVAGATIGAGIPILVLGSNDRGRVMRVGLPDRDALRMKVGDRASAQFDAVPGRTFSGRVALLGRAADARTGTYIAEIALDAAESLPAGLVGRVSLSPRAGAVATLIPIDALVEADKDSAVIYTASNSQTPTAERHAVQILFLTGDRVAVRTEAGSEALDRVIAKGAQYLSHEMPVRIVSDPNAGTARGTEAAKSVSANAVRP